jgi:hypothetical protein
VIEVNKNKLVALDIEDDPFHNLTLPLICENSWHRSSGDAWQG